MAAVVTRRRFRVRGVVQGVGFRPFVHRLARSHGLGGFVLNDGEGVVVEAEGDEAALAAFAEELRTEAPGLARVDSVTAESLEPAGESSFRILASIPTAATALIPADVATCDDCLRELFDPADRRYRYPFLNCTQCGPRFTIVRSSPYDRARTTMAGFELCSDCRREYEDPDDRRFHAEPTCCPACGPRLTPSLEEAEAVLRAGGIVAVKGIGRSCERKRSAIAPRRRRCEDSVVRAGLPVRRSRGHLLAALPLPDRAPPLVAAGAELKSTFCVARDGEAFLSAHLGDLDSEAAYRAFRDDLELYLSMLGVEPELVAHDLHPEYLATKWALEQDAELVGVQHHHAHAAACLAEHGEGGPALALVFDGTGYGTDGTLWGAELLRCDLARFERLAHLEPVPLPGGEAAIREPWRMAAVHLERAGLPVPWPEWERVRESLKLDPPLASGMGRLFDAVAAVLGVRERVTYEGQAAVELERLAGEAPAEPYAWRFGDPTDLVTVCYLELRAGRPHEEVAARFHETVAAAGAEACAEAGGPRTVVLSGGSFQNLRLLHSTRARLEARGFRVLSHRLVPPNDGGISYGQAAVAARRAACA